MDNHSPEVVPELSRSQVTALRIKLIGGMLLLTSGTEATLPVRLHTRRLLAFLVLASGVVNRAVVATQLWPDLPEKKALAALRRHLSDLRAYSATSLNGMISIVRHGQNLELHFTSQHRVDVADLFALLNSIEAQVQSPSPKMKSVIAQMLAATTRPLLDGWDDKWLESPRMWITYARQVLSDVISSQSDHRNAPSPTSMIAPASSGDLAPFREVETYGMQTLRRTVAALKHTAPTSALDTAPQSTFPNTSMPDTPEYPSHFHSPYLRHVNGEHHLVLDDLSDVDRKRTAAPLRLDSFVGRQPDFELLRQSLVERALVVVTGLIGVGKTRLVAEYLVRDTSRSSESFYWIDGDSGSITSPPCVLPMRAGLSATDRVVNTPIPAMSFHRTDQLSVDTVAVAVSESPSRTIPSRTLSMAENSRCDHCFPIVVFDHFDLRPSLLHEGIRASRLHFPNACIVAILRVSHELPNATVLDIAPLSVSSPQSSRRLAEARQESHSSEASVLFHARMTELGAHESPTEITSTLVSEVCARIEGNPLAIEVYAERSLVMSLSELASMTRVALGSGGADRPLNTSSQYLNERLETAWEGTSLVHLQCMERLWIFQNNFGIDDLLCIASNDLAARRCVDDLTDQANSLTRCPWIEANPRHQHAIRYRVPKIAREYAQWKSRFAPHVAATRQTHARHYLSKVASLTASAVGFDEVALDASLDSDRDDICSAIAMVRLDDDADLQVAIDAAVVLWRYWISRGMLGEETAWVEHLVSLAAESGCQLQHALSCDVAAMMHYALGDVMSAAQYGRRSVRSFRTCGPSDQMSVALIHLAGILAMSGEMTSARLLAREAVGYVTPSGDLVHAIDVLGLAADIFVRSGEVQSADEILATARGLVGTIVGSPRKASRVYLRLGTTAIERGEYKLACELLHIAEQQSKRLVGTREHSRVLAELALAMRWMGRTKEAARILARVTTSSAKAGDRMLQLICLCNLADIWCDEMQWQSALLSINYARDVSEVSIASDLILDICNIELVVALALGDTSRQIELVTNMLDLAGSVEDPISVGWAYRTLSAKCLHSGDLLHARHFCGESVRRLHSCGSLGSLLRSVEAASCSVSVTSPTTAAHILGACTAERARIGAPRTPREVKDVESWTAAITVILGPEDTQVQFRAGERISFEEAVDVALSHCSSQEMPTL